jgi:hypothetical protein
MGAQGVGDSDVNATQARKAERGPIFVNGVRLGRMALRSSWLNDRSCRRRLVSNLARREVL